MHLNLQKKVGSARGRVKDKFLNVYYMYKITRYTYNKAKTMGVKVKPSTRKNKKIDVYKDNKLIGSVGAYGINDFPTYIQKCGMTYAKKRRELYRMRHRKDRTKKWTNGWLADQLLW